MQNISDIPQKTRRRCASEGKRGKGRPRPVSAVLYPPSRVRADTEPSSPLSSYCVGLASSAKNLSLSESPKSKPSPGLNRFLPRRKSKDGKLWRDGDWRTRPFTVPYFFVRLPGSGGGGGDVAAARRRSHQWSVSLTPSGGWWEARNASSQTASPPPP